MYTNLLNKILVVTSSRNTLELSGENDFLFYWDSNLLSGFTTASRIVNLLNATKDSKEKTNLIEMMKSAKFFSRFLDELCFSCYSHKGVNLFDYLQEKKFVINI